MLALVADPGLAVGAGVAWRAGAGVGSLAGVPACGAVAAGLVVGAVVEVLVAEETAPALVAATLVGLLAGAVHAAGVELALVAVRAGPAGLAAVERMSGRMSTKLLFLSLFFVLWAAARKGRFSRTGDAHSFFT